MEQYVDDVDEDAIEFAVRLISGLAALYVIFY